MAEEKALTVLGWIDSKDLGKTLCHEHLLINAEALYVPPLDKHKEESEKDLKDIENLHWLRYFPYSHHKNLHVEEESILEKELRYFKEKGGSTIVDVTICGIRPEIEESGISYATKIKELSQKTGVNIICGTGFYVAPVHPPRVDTDSIEQLADFMIAEITEGILPDKTVKTGVIGEIGCSFPLLESEKKVLKAAALAQKKTGAPLIIHPGRDESAPMQIVKILQEAGADISKTVMSHLDRTLFSSSRWKELADTGIYLELDLFGIECSYYQQNNAVYMPHDGLRIERVAELVKGGYVNQIMLSHDIHTNHRLISFGGHGYSHLFDRILPRLITAGLNIEQIDQIVIHNPRKWLTFAPQ